MKLRVKSVVAVIGGFVVVGMGVLTVAVGGSEAHAKVIGGSGDTVTQTTPPSTPAIASATPTLKAPPPSA